MKINYSIADCPLGQLLVAATGKGVCSVALGDSEESLLKALSEQYPASDIQRGDALLKEVIKQIQNYLSGSQPHIDLPVDISSSEFRSRVYKVLKGIPGGETRSYEEIARSIGQPTAVRAVASACAKNPVALLIPCHRVIRKDGSMGGYRWGLERKKRLLDMEENSS